MRQNAGTGNAEAAAGVIEDGLEEIAFEGAQVVTPANVSLVQDLNLRCGWTLATPPLKSLAQYQSQSHPLNAKQRCHNLVHYGNLLGSLAWSTVMAKRQQWLCLTGSWEFGRRASSGPMSASLCSGSVHGSIR